MSPSSFQPKERQVFAVNLEQQRKSEVVVSCRDFERYYGTCENRLRGWFMPLAAGSVQEAQVRRSGRAFTEAPKGALIEFRFPPGQDCFGHRVPTQPPRLMHFEGATEFADWHGSQPVSSVTPIMRRNAKPWAPPDFMEKLHEETDKRDEALRREGLS